MAGAAGVAPWRFGLAILIGRGVRYFGQGYLAVRYGEQAAAMVRSHGSTVGLVLAGLVLAGAALYYGLRRQRVKPSRSGRSDGSNGR